MRAVRVINVLVWLIVLKVVGTGISLSANEPRPDHGPQIEFFEKHVRPLLAGACYRCHAKGDKSKGGLRLDSPEGFLAGGKRGPAVVPGKPDDSLLIQAVRGALGAELKMPPDRELSDRDISCLVQWIEAGAIWPPEGATRPEPAAADTQAKPEQFWTFRPVGDPAPPAVQDDRWPTSPIDRFILHRLETEGLSPAQPADRAALLRRVTFDLIGLPPTPEEIAAFLADELPDAFAKVVDRLLASPHYGERWGRHWLDLVRYVETNGLDFDTNKSDIYRYRDYVIEAFNDDVPYDQFIREHLAGDLLPQPRISRDGARVCSPIGSGFLWFGEMLEEPNDDVSEAENEVESQIDVIGKCFLGLTLACARCHDHKFDPIVQTDYQALALCLMRSSDQRRCVDSDQRQAEIREHWRALHETERRITALTGDAKRELLHAQQAVQQAQSIKAYLLATRELVGQRFVSNKDLNQAAEAAQLNRDRIGRWVDRLRQVKEDPNSPFFAWSALARFAPQRFPSRARSLVRYLEAMDVPAQPIAPPPSGEDQIFADFDGDDFGDWTVVGQAFGERPVPCADAGVEAVRGQGCADSRSAGTGLVGRLVSRRFKIEKPFLNLSVAGGDFPGETGVQVILLHAAAPNLRGLRFATGKSSPNLIRQTMNLTPFLGREVIIEIVDNRTDDWGYVVVDDMRFSDTPDVIGDAPAMPASAADELRLNDVRRLNRKLLKSGKINSIAGLAERYQAAVTAACEAWQARLEGRPRQDALDFDDAELEILRDWATADDSPLVSLSELELALAPEEQAELESLRRQRDALRHALPESAIALVSSAEPRINEATQFIDLDDRERAVQAVPFLPSVGSALPLRAPLNRLALADWIASTDNPLTARVLVNRLWLHHFGRGLVATPDNFGQLGERPTHHELLDFLARRFIESGWSIKAMHRLVLLSSTYQQSSQADPRSVQHDRDNRLVHHVPCRRLDAECVRDSILAVAGTLDRRMYGPGVKLYFAPSQSGDDLPASSGPLDGDCRRSVYLEVRRNHLPSFLQTFDFPKPDGCVGRRESSVVPAQALLMLNNPFLSQQAAAWAKRLMAQRASPDERLETMYLEAFSRLPTPSELQLAKQFLTSRSRKHAQPPGDAELKSWSDLCHLAFNLGEFLFVR